MKEKDDDKERQTQHRFCLVHPSSFSVILPRETPETPATCCSRRGDTPGPIGSAAQRYGRPRNTEALLFTSVGASLILGEDWEAYRLLAANGCLHMGIGTGHPERSGPGCWTPLPGGAGRHENTFGLVLGNSHPRTDRAPAAGMAVVTKAEHM